MGDIDFFFSITFAFALLYTYLSEKEPSKRWYVLLNSFTNLSAFFIILTLFTDTEHASKVYPTILIILLITRFLRDNHKGRYDEKTEDTNRGGG